VKLWRSGIFWTIISFVGSIGNFAFSALTGHCFTKAEFGYSNTALNLISFLGLPLSMIGTALVHYIAHFRGQNDEAGLQGALATGQKFLLQATVVCSLLAVVLAVPVGHTFQYRNTLIVVAIASVLVNVWSGFAVSLCQGMSWFKRLALVNLAAVVLRLLFGLFVTVKHPTAEMAVLATTFSWLANLTLLYWWKTIFRHDAPRTSLWTAEFYSFLLVTAAYVGGNWFFLNGDALVSQKYFVGDDLGAYQAVAKWGVALPGAVAPLLLVVFTSRSSGRHAQAVADQKILLTLYSAGLAFGALMMILLRGVLIKILIGPNPQAASMMIPYVITMALVGMGQAIAMWALASRWFKLSALYGALGLVYWLLLIEFGRTPNELLGVMPYGAGGAFVILLAWWLYANHQAQAKKA
jgi:O-antigen/teichoic acid export membrane protein